jgi:hypothetical protein
MPVRSGWFPAAAQHGSWIIYEFARRIVAAERIGEKRRPLTTCGYSVADLGAPFAE